MYEDSIVGVTTDEYVEIPINVNNIRNFCLLLKNTGETNSLTYKILSKVNVAGTLENTEVAEAPVVADAMVKYETNDTCRSQIIIAIKSTSEGDSTDYLIEYCKLRK